jgi:hypothetical protein
LDNLPFLKVPRRFLVCLILLLFAGTPASADIYRYKDKDGVWHFSNIKSNKHYELFIRWTPNHASKNITKDDTKDYEEVIRQASSKFQVESSLIKAIIKAESDFDHRAVSSKGAQGLMQLMPDTACDMNVKNCFDPKENILGGTRYLSLLLKRFNNNKTLALAAYNAGPEEVASRQGIPPFEETRTFVEKVMNYYQTYNGGAE